MASATGTGVQKLPASLGTVRLTLAVLVGIVAGVLPLTGWNGWGAAAVAILMIPYVFAKAVLGIKTGDDAPFTDSEVAQEKSMQALMLYLLCWIVSFNHLPHLKAD